MYPLPVLLRPCTGFSKDVGRRVSNDYFKCFNRYGCPSIRPSQMEMRNSVLTAKNFDFPIPVMMKAGHMKRV